MLFMINLQYDIRQDLVINQIEYPVPKMFRSSTEDVRTY